jgi:hypothetical protein
MELNKFNSIGLDYSPTEGVSLHLWRHRQQSRVQNNSHVSGTPHRKKNRGLARGSHSLNVLTECQQCGIEEKNAMWIIKATALKINV